jgi:hypothetical protein
LDYVGIALPEFTACVSSHHLLEKLEKLHADVKLIQTFNRGDLEDIVLYMFRSEIVPHLQTQTYIDRGHITPDYGTMKSYLISIWENGGAEMSRCRLPQSTPFPPLHTRIVARLSNDGYLRNIYLNTWNPL